MGQQSLGLQDSLEPCKTGLDIAWHDAILRLSINHSFKLQRSNDFHPTMQQHHQWAQEVLQGIASVPHKDWNLLDPVLCVPEQ
jgi:hypothetical protein